VKRVAVKDKNSYILKKAVALRKKETVTPLRANCSLNLLKRVAICFPFFLDLSSVVLKSATEVDLFRTVSFLFL